MDPWTWNVYLLYSCQNWKKWLKYNIYKIVSFSYGGQYSENKLCGNNFDNFFEVLPNEACFCTQNSYIKSSTLCTSALNKKIS